MRAVVTARRHGRHGIPYDLETGRFRGRGVWEIKVAKRHVRPYELAIGAHGRRVRHASRHKRDDDVRKALKARTGLRRALRAGDRRARGRLDEAEIDRYRGMVVWTVTFQRGQRETEVISNARTGKVIAVRHEQEED
jgi:uncharacterized membrane protein YkoI